MADTLYLDFETFSETPIKNGTYRYLQDCEPLLFAYAFNDDEPQVVDFTAGEAFPRRVRDAFTNPDVLLVAHNAMFDRNVLAYACDIKTPLERWHCTMVHAMLHSLPGGLDLLSDIFGLGDAAKDKDGKKLIQLFCKPVTRGRKKIRLSRDTNPEEWERFVQYAKQDIPSCRKLHQTLPQWNLLPQERAYYLQDQKRNDRGFRVDLELAHAALSAVDAAQADLKQETQRLTEGQLQSTSQRDATLEFILQTFGVSLPDLQSGTLERRLQDPDIPEEVKELLRIRLQVSTTSTSKYKALVKGVNEDGYLRGTIQFCGAIRTARDAGRTFQPQNLPSRGLLPQPDIEKGVRALKIGCAGLIYDNVMQLTSSTIRSTIVPPDGGKIVCADLSNIEGRMLAWLAGEEWKLQAFRDFDRGTGHDLYNLTYSKSFAVDPGSVTKQQRNIGKVQELALGYEGGVGAFIAFALAYNIDLDDMADQAWETLPALLLKESKGFYDWTVKKRRSTFGLSEKTFIVCNAIKTGWRQAHPNTVALWKALDDMFRRAIQNPGETFRWGRIACRRDGNWVRIILPSGRSLCYPSPRIDDRNVSYMGINQYTRKWERIKTHGGKLAENCIAEGTRVATRRGWVPIERVSGLDEVWDGQEYVRTSGSINKGKQVVSQVFGVYMTADHLVLTTEGWKHARESEGYNRAASRVPHGYSVRGQRRTEKSLGDALRLWKDHINESVGAGKTKKERDTRFVWVHADSDDTSAPNPAWNVVPSCVCRMALDARPLSIAFAQGMEKLRRAGRDGLRKVAGELREFLGGYGAYLPNRFFAGPFGQQLWVLPLKLRVENSSAPSQQQEKQPQDKNTERRYDGIGGRQRIWHKILNPSLPARPRVAHRESVATVYDLVNCGPRNRFVVQANDGTALIVHNCTQAASRDVFKHGELLAEEAGFEVVLPVHDELVTYAPNSPEYNPERLGALMATNPDWADGLPLAAAGFEASRYMKG